MASGLAAGPVAAARVPSRPSAVRVLQTRAVPPSGTLTAPARLSASPVSRTLAGPLTPAQQRMATALTVRVADPRLGWDVTGAVVDAATGQLVWGRRAGDPMLPASVAKLATAVTALHTLGAATPLVTTVTTGRRSDEIVLTGGGDPMLRSVDLGRLADRTAAVLRAGGTTTVSLAYDDTRFGWPFAAVGWPAGTTPGQVPPVRALVVNKQPAVNTGAHAALLFSILLRNRHVGVLPVIARIGPVRGAAALASVAAHTAGDVVREMLQTSDNLDAEYLHRLAAIAAGMPPTWAGAATAQGSVLVSLGVPLAGVQVRDGSGLSRSDRSTALELAALLTAVAQPPDPALGSLGQALPVAGVSGTLGPWYKRFATAPSSCARGLVLAKTGSLHDVASLAGIAPDADGSPQAFAFFVNRRTATLGVRQALDGLAATVTGCW